MAKKVEVEVDVDVEPSIKALKEFYEENIGVKIKDEYQDKIDSGYLFYYFKYLHIQGMFRPIAHGTLALKNITISDIKSIPVNFK